MNAHTHRRFFNHKVASTLGLLAATLAVGAVCRTASAADFLKPTPEELSLTSLKGYPGAPAVILFREEITKDDLHSVEHYERLKVLTDEGKKYANVELGYVSTGGGWMEGDNKTLEQISGRTIHPDGTIIPFTGKPYLKVLEKSNGFKVQEKVFTLPDVEVGSIIEYRYYTRIEDNIVEPPIWMVQDDLYVKEAHFKWWPTTRNIVDENGQTINSIHWFPILPAGAKIDHQEIPGSSLSNGPKTVYDLVVKDVPPRAHEEFMPPIRSYSFRVNFSYSPYRTPQEYWQNTGKNWSKRVNSFTGPNGDLRDATAKVIAGANTPEEKLTKIYGAVMNLENTRYTRERENREEKAAGLGEVKNAADVLSHGRGTPGQLTELFVGMARAAGLNAYLMWVPDREQEIFLPDLMDTRQLDDYVAVVKVNEQERFFDPGSRYTPFGQLAWQHTGVGGIRQTDGGTAIVNTPFESYKVNREARVANLKMSDTGEVTGKIDLSFTGSPATRWRQVALRSDEQNLRKELKEHAEAMVPKTLELEVADVKDVAAYDKPLAVTLTVKGTLGTSMGKRVTLPADLFLANQAATFPHQNRELAVYFPYPRMVQDAVRINLPPNLAVEAVPSEASYSLPKLGAYVMKVKEAPTNFTTTRDFVFGDILVMPKDYGNLRSFYGQFESKDQEPVVLKPTAAAPVTASASPAL